MLAAKGALFAALSSLCKVIDRHTTMPILTHVRLDASGGTLRLLVTDLTTWLAITVPCEGRLSACLPSQALRDFVKPDCRADRASKVELKLVEDGQVVVAYEGAMTTLAAMPVGDFPARPGDKHPARSWRGQATWDAAELADKLGWVLLAVSLDETRPHLTGVYFDREQVVAVDGHRLHLARLPGMSGGPALIPGKSVAALLHVLPKQGEVSALRAEEKLRFRAGDWELETRAMEGQFPPYDQVIPAEGSEAFRAVVERGRMAHALSRIPRAALRRSHHIRLKVNGKVELLTDGDSGAATIAVPVVSTTHEGPDFTMGINPHYLADAVAEGEERVTALHRRRPPGRPRARPGPARRRHARAPVAGPLHRYRSHRLP